MRFTHLSFENYRAFVRPQEIELRPLTLVYGYNHAGKSALLRSLALLAESSTGTYSAPLNLLSNAVHGAAFKDIRSYAQPDEPVHFGLRAKAADGTDFSWKAAFDDYGLRSGRHTISRWESRWSGPAGAGSVLASTDPVATTGPERHRNYQLSGDIGGKLLPLCIAPVRLEGLLPQLVDGSSAYEPAFEQGRRLLRGLREQLQWLEAVRQRPERRVGLPGAPVLRMSPNGEEAGQILAADSQEQGELIAAVQDFFRGSAAQMDSYNFRVQPEGDYFRLKLAPAAAPLMETDIADAGEGITQVIPVLVALARASRGSPDDPRLLVLEQPELHLHPRMEVRLGRELCKRAAASSPPTMLVETHSEALLLSIQLALLDSLDPSSVAIYWVRQLPEGESIVERVQIGDDGALDHHWPPGTFGEATSMALQVAKRRLSRESR